MEASIRELKRNRVPHLMGDIASLEFNPMSCVKCSGTMVRCPDGIPQCDSCGYLNAVTLDQSPEWRIGDDCGDERPRCGPPPLHPMIPQVAPKPGLSSTASSEMRNIRRWISWVRSRSNQGRDYVTICAGARQANLPDGVALRAADWFEALTNVIHARSSSRIGLAATALGLACREAGSARSQAELVKAFPGLEKTDIIKAESDAAGAINILERRGTVPGHPPPIEPVDFVGRLAAGSGATHATQLAKFIAQRVHAHKLITGHSPHAIAAVCVCIAASALKLQINRSELRSATDLSEVTLGKIQKKLHVHIKTILPPSIQNAYLQSIK